MVWPQVSLAQMAALLHPVYTLKIIDANAERMGWPEFDPAAEPIPTEVLSHSAHCSHLENDMYGCFLAKARGAKTIAFGTHVTPDPT